MSARHILNLREEHDGPNSRHLSAYLDDAGDLHIDGHDLGPGTAPVSEDGEYEWFRTISAVDLPRLTQLLDAHHGESILAVLSRKYTGKRSYDLEQILRASDIPQTLRTWSG